MDIQWGEIVSSAVSVGTLLLVAARLPSDRKSASSKSSSDIANTFKTYVETVQDLNDRLLKRNTEFSELSVKVDSLESKLLLQRQYYRRLIKLERQARIVAETERDELKNKVNTLEETVAHLQKMVENLQTPSVAVLPSPQS